MIKKSKIYFALAGILLLSFTTTVSAEMKNVASSQQLPTKNEMIVAYYGRPGVKSLSVLGQHSLLSSLITSNTASGKKCIKSSLCS